MPIHRPSISPYVVAIILIGILISVSLPIMPQTRIRVTTDRDIIKNVSVDTPRVPLIAKLFPLSRGTGAYTIKVEVTKNTFMVFNETLQDVPSGDFILIWIHSGTPESGTYHIVVHLLRGNIEVDTYSLDVEF